MIVPVRTCIGIVAILLTLAIPLSAWAQTPPSAALYMNNDNDTKTVSTSGGTVNFAMTVENTGGSTGNIAVCSAGEPAGWTVNLSMSTAEITPGSRRNFSVQVVVPSGTAPGNYPVTIYANASGLSEVPPCPGDATNPADAAHTLTIIVSPATATPTPTNTPVGTTNPTPSITPTRTPGPCDDRPDDTHDTAFEIKINIPERQTLCPEGDEDWYFFGGLSGKVYTIDIPTADAGIDPSIGLYDAYGNLIAYNDDFPRGGTADDPDDILPRIESWRAPANGHYFIRVRDAATSGRSGAFYTIAVISESYGPTPTLIAEICQDLFEPDGLPEQANLMVVGEIQPDHRLCPAGDADWIRFFAARNKTYTIATSNLTVGADTVMVLADRDGVSIIDFSDDFGGTLASRIVFTPRVDGFYYVQVKNIGDIGNQFIGYTLTLTVGGGPAVTPQPTSPGTTATPTLGTATPSPTLGAGTPSPSPTQGTVTPTPTSNSYTLLSDKVPVANAPGGRFIDPAFANIWQRSDAPVAEQRTQRSWIWGPQALVARAEIYDQSSGGLRQVQYFDKARMEISDHSADRGSLWFVTNGLLVRELIEGRVQIGESSYVNLSPADIVIAGDLDGNGPTYASFKQHLAPAGDRTGSAVDKTIDRAGNLSGYDGPARPETRLVTYIPETGHNIPQVFWDFFNSRGPIAVDGQIINGPIVDWVFAMGYPISEPFWASISVGGSTRWVLVQAFERRVLTYTPDNPQNWRVEMGNVGLHYYYWRYGVLPR